MAQKLAPAPIMLTQYKLPWFRMLSFPVPDQPQKVDAGGAVIMAKLQAVRTSNTW